jgi:two-component system chemotaxis response regulator CheB
VIKVLVVDDSPLVRKLFSRVLTDEPGFEIAIARDGVEALDKLESFRPDVVTLDVNMPQMNGLECLDRIMVLRPCPVVMVSSVTEAGADAALNALRLGAVDFVSKPTGAVSLQMDSFAPTFLEKIRAAASAKLPASKRLKERVQLRTAGMRPARAQLGAAENIEAEIAAATGSGLVLIGTSTGGPPALETLLTALPQNFPWPILVAQHMPAGFTGAFAKRLNGICALDVVEASRPMQLKPGCIYIGQGDADIVVSRRSAGLVVMAAPAKSSYLWHPSTDRLVRSAMDHLPASQLVGVLMTGMGNDGAQAMTELRAKGGKTIAEAEETAVVWGMPGELVKAGGADWVVPLPRIADRLRKLVPSDATDS